MKVQNLVAIVAIMIAIGGCGAIPTTTEPAPKVTEDDGCGGLCPPPPPKDQRATRAVERGGKIFFEK